MDVGPDIKDLVVEGFPSRDDQAGYNLEVAHQPSSTDTPLTAGQVLWPSGASSGLTPANASLAFLNQLIRARMPMMICGT